MLRRGGQDDPVPVRSMGGLHILNIIYWGKNERVGSKGRCTTTSPSRY